MYLACAQGNIDVVKWLCRRKASTDLVKPANSGATPLLKACEGDFIEIVELAIQQGIPAPYASNFPVQHLSAGNRRKLYDQAIVVRDVDHESFLALAMARCCCAKVSTEVTSCIGVHQLPMDVLH